MRGRRMMGAGVALAVVADMDLPAIPDRKQARRGGPVFRLHFGRVGVGHPQDEERGQKDERQSAQNAPEPFHGAISSIQRRTMVSPSSSTVALPSSGIATPGSGLAMR